MTSLLSLFILMDVALTLLCTYLTSLIPSAVSKFQMKSFSKRRLKSDMPVIGII